MGMANVQGTIVSKQFEVRRQEGKLKSGVPVVVYHKPGAPISVRASFLAGAGFVLMGVWMIFRRIDERAQPVTAVESIKPVVPRA